MHAIENFIFIFYSQFRDESDSNKLGQRLSGF
jgi:hypothetical protein